MSIRNYYKSHLLDFCRSLIYYKDQQIAINQSRILAKLQDPKKQNIFYREKGRERKGKRGEEKEPQNENLADYIIRLVGEFS